MGKPVGIVRKTIYNNHGTKYRLVRKSGGGGGVGKTLYLKNRLRQQHVSYTKISAIT